MSNKVNFWQTDKHETFWQADTMIFDVNDQAFPEFPNQPVCNVFTISQKKKLEMKYKLVSTLRASNCPTR